jgi:hypothetical protein
MTRADLPALIREPHHRVLRREIDGAAYNACFVERETPSRWAKVMTESLRFVPQSRHGEVQISEFLVADERVFNCRQYFRGWRKRNNLFFREEWHGSNLDLDCTVRQTSV